MVDHATARRSLDTREDRGAPANCVISNVIWSVLGTQVGVYELELLGETMSSKDITLR